MAIKTYFRSIEGFQKPKDVGLNVHFFKAKEHVYIKGTNQVDKNTCLVK